MSDFDVIVVGAGPAGSSAAIKLASSGSNVLLVERADPPGSKAVSGGILWGKELEKVVPDWEKVTPLERFIEYKSTAFLTEESKVSVDFRTKKFEKSKTGYSVLRAKLDQFLAQKAKAAGATLVTGITVDSLSMKDGIVNGVVQDGETVTANTVILAEGTNPRVAIEAGLMKPLSDLDSAIGIKEVVKLSENTINERFNLKGNAGYAGEFVLGFLEGGVRAGGFMYTNKDSLSVGVVISLPHLRENGKTYAYDIMEKFMQHPYVSPLVEGGQVQEYSAHLVSEGGVNSMPDLYGDGYMIAGDSAGFTFSNGMVIQGMNYAIASGVLAAETAIEAIKKKEFTRGALSSYQSKLERSQVLMDLRKFRGIDRLVWSRLVHETAPEMLENILFGIFYEDGSPKKHLANTILQGISGSNMKKSELIMETYRMLRRM